MRSAGAEKEGNIHSAQHARFEVYDILNRDERWVANNMNRWKLNKESGFTLVEMAAVLLIISILLLLIVPSMSNGKTKADKVSCEGSVRIIQSEINLYYAENGAYPASLATIDRAEGAGGETQYVCQQKTYRYDANTGELSL